MRFKIVSVYKKLIVDNHMIRIYKCNRGKRLGYLAVFIYEKGCISLGVHNNPRKAINRAKGYISSIRELTRRHYERN